MPLDFKNLQVLDSVILNRIDAYRNQHLQRKLNWNRTENKLIRLIQKDNKQRRPDGEAIPPIKELFCFGIPKE
jgi:hypothetical protein